MSLETLVHAGNESVAARRGAARAGSALVLSLFAGFCLYCALSVVMGPAGLVAYRRLEERNRAMEANLGDLGTRRDRLNAELESLKTDPDRAAREARALGYLRPGETALILGERDERIRAIDAGKVLPFAMPATPSDAMLKEISLGACLAMMALLLAPSGARTRRRRERRRGSA
jgi:cell division protein FtsB